MKKIISKYWKGSFRVGAIFTSGNIIVAIVGALSTLLYGRWIDPDVLGEFRKYAILTGYLGFGIVFVDGAFQRHFPYYIGKGELAKAKEVAGNAKWMYLAMVWVGVVVFGVLAIIALIRGDTNAVMGWLVQLPIFVVATFGLYLKILYRTNQNFLTLNKNNLIAAGAGLLSLPLVYFFEFAGLAARAFTRNVVDIFMHLKNAPYKIKARYNRNALIELAKVSLPLQIPAYLDTKVLKASVALIILRTLGQEALGIFALALMLQNFLLVFSKSLNQIVTTKLMLKYGSNNSIKETFKYIIKWVLVITGIGLIMVLVFNISIGFLINHFLPKYIASVVVVQILAFELVLALISCPFSLFISSLMYKEMIFIRVTKLVLTILLLVFFHDSLEQVAAIIILANLLNVVAGYIMLFMKMKEVN